MGTRRPGGGNKRGVKLICWNVFSIQDVRDVDDFQIAKRYPQWQMEYIDVPGVDYGPRAGMCVLSSPCLEHHARLIQEVASLGVDAMWCDGFYLGGIPHPIRPGCVCSHCRDRGADGTDTGRLVFQLLNASAFYGFGNGCGYAGGAGGAAEA